MKWWWWWNAPLIDLLCFAAGKNAGLWLVGPTGGNRITGSFWGQRNCNPLLLGSEVARLPWLAERWWPKGRHGTPKSQASQWGTSAPIETQPLGAASRWQLMRCVQYGGPTSLGRSELYMTRRGESVLPYGYNWLSKTMTCCHFCLWFQPALASSTAETTYRVKLGLG